MIRQSALLVVATTMILAVSHAQPCKITGTITDKNTGEPLIGANVLIKGTERGCATNINGEWSIYVPTPGTYTLLATYLGYQRHDTTVTIDLQTSIEISFQLETEEAPGVYRNIQRKRPPHVRLKQTHTPYRKANTNAQYGSIRGTVQDSARRGPLGGASVTLLETGHSTETDLYGKYRLDRVPVGSYTLKIFYPGFDTLYVDSVRVARGVTSLAPAFLRPPSINLFSYPTRTQIKINWTTSGGE